MMNNGTFFYYSWYLIYIAFKLNVLIIYVSHNTGIQIYWWYFMVYKEKMKENRREERGSDLVTMHVDVRYACYIK